MGTLRDLVSKERKKRIKEVEKPVQPRTREPFDEEAWNEVYKQACEDLTPEELEACKYITPTDSLSADLLTPEEFAALTL